jgi:hypothetical protein
MLSHSSSRRARGGITLVLGLIAGTAPFTFAAIQTGSHAAQVFEPFDTNAREDANAYRREERALWGRDGRLSATTHFSGTGGPNGDFDWRVRVLPGGAATVLDTTFAVITDDTQTQTPNGRQRLCQRAQLGDRPGRSARHPWTARLLHRGLGHGAHQREDPRQWSGQSRRRDVANRPGPTRRRRRSGRRARRRRTSDRSGAVVPRGAAGFGAFNAPGQGGGGGESGFSASLNVDARRGAGGGGGRFGADMLLASGCPNQTIIGLDAEDGSDGSISAGSAIAGVGQRPSGGAVGASPFVDANSANDFWGRMVLPAETNCSVNWPAHGRAVAAAAVGMRAGHRASRRRRTSSVSTSSGAVVVRRGLARDLRVGRHRVRRGPVVSTLPAAREAAARTRTASTASAAPAVEDPVGTSCCRR